MAKEKLPKIYKRRWLNRSEGSAYIIIAGEVESWSKSGSTSLNLDVEIKDCTRQCSLEFWANDVAQWKERIAKMDGLIKSLQEARAFLEANPPKKGKSKKKDDTPKFIEIGEL